MGPLFNPRRMARTPGFVQDGLYDELDMAEQDDYERSLPPQSSPLPDSAQFDDAPLPPRETNENYNARVLSHVRDNNVASAPLPSPMREYESGPSVDPGPQMRQRITLDAAPLPPKTGVLRKILGGVASIYAPMFANEIKAPGYDRQMREYNANRQRMMDEGKLNVQAADEEYKIAAARRQMADAETAAARKQAELSRAGSYGRPVIHGKPGETIFNQDGGVFATVAPLPPNAKSTIKIGRDGKPFFGEGVEGKDYILADSSVAPSIINSTARPDRGLAYFSQLVDKKMPNATQDEKDAEIVRLANEQQKLKEEESKARANRANRLPGGRTTSPTAGAAEARRSMDEKALAAIADAGSLDAAIAAATDTALLQALKAKKGKQALTPPKGSKIEALATALGGGTKKPTTTAPKPAGPNKADPLGVR